MTALIVEDDADAREIAVRSVTDAGGAAVAVATAGDALGMLASGTTRIDVLISDVGLPGTDGYALLTAIRALPGQRGVVPAIAVTAYATESDAKRANKAGFCAHVTKPYSPVDLVAAVRNAFDSRTR
jgi:CheY-like chemotaxis protein